MHQHENYKVSNRIRKNIPCIPAKTEFLNRHGQVGVEESCERPFQVLSGLGQTDLTR